MHSRPRSYFERVSGVQVPGPTPCTMSAYQLAWIHDGPGMLPASQVTVGSRLKSNMASIVIPIRRITTTRIMSADDQFAVDKFTAIELRSPIGADGKTPLKARLMIGVRWEGFEDDNDSWEDLATYLKDPVLVPQLLEYHSNGGEGLPAAWVKKALANKKRKRDKKQKKKKDKQERKSRKKTKSTKSTNSTLTDEQKRASVAQWGGTVVGSSKAAAVLETDLEADSRPLEKSSTLGARTTSASSRVAPPVKPPRRDASLSRQGSAISPSRTRPSSQSEVLFSGDEDDEEQPMPPSPSPSLLKSPRGARAHPSSSYSSPRSWRSLASSSSSGMEEKTERATASSSFSSPRSSSASSSSGVGTNVEPGRAPSSSSFSSPNSARSSSLSSSPAVKVERGPGRQSGDQYHCRRSSRSATSPMARRQATLAGLQTFYSGQQVVEPSILEFETRIKALNGYECPPPPLSPSHLPIHPCTHPLTHDDTPAHALPLIQENPT
jgi:hypothetical protein